MTTINYFLTLFVILIVVLCDAQSDRFVMGEDLLNVQSSSINKKLSRASFSTSDDLYIKAVLPQSVASMISKYDGTALAILISSTSSKSYNLIYPELRKEHLSMSEIIFALYHSSKLPKDVVDVQKDYLNMLRKATEPAPEIEIALVITSNDKQILHTITSRNITIK